MKTHLSFITLFSDNATFMIPFDTIKFSAKNNPLGFTEKITANVKGRVPFKYLDLYNKLKEEGTNINGFRCSRIWTETTACYDWRETEFSLNSSTNNIGYTFEFVANPT